MEHLSNAKEVFLKEKPELANFLKVDENRLLIKVQDGPLAETDQNGMQASDLLEFVKELFISLNNSFPCQENKDSIRYIERALYCQNLRTKRRERMGIEGKNVEMTESQYAKFAKEEEIKKVQDYNEAQKNKIDNES